MLSSIHPLGERARNNNWGVTVTAFTLGAVLSGAALGALLGLAGRATVGTSSPTILLGITAMAILAAGVLDLVRVQPPGPKRQVNENWIGTFRGWVYGGGFGLELGVGFLTYIVTWGVFATYASAFLTVTPISGALVGATFGFGRSLTLIAAGYVDRPSRLTSFNRRLASLGPVVRHATAAAMSVAGVGLILAGALT